MNQIRKLGCALLLSSAVSDGALAVNCTNYIDAIPAVIERPGTYCTTFSYAYTPIISGAAIEIRSDNVILDMTYGGIDNRDAGPGTAAIGVYALNHSNITVQNGSIRNIDNRTAALPLDVGIYIIDSKRVQTISNKFTNVRRNVLRS